MDKITISNGVTTITMPRTNSVVDSGEVLATESTMASGKIVRDIKGFRAGFTYSWDYVPADTIAQLVAFARTGGFFTVGYFDVDGTEKSGTFSLSYPAFGVFCYKNGVAVWHNCKLTIKAQGVS